MPTATSLSGYTIFNNGPLTTTFTAPASCITAAADTAIAVATDPAEAEWDANCGLWLPPANCNPNGNVIRSIISSADSSNPQVGYIIVYHSPGLICPSGWSTAGSAARANPTSVNVAGAFNASIEVPSLPSGAPLEFFEPELDVFLAALDPGETAIACCPRFAFLFPTLAQKLICTIF